MSAYELAQLNIGIIRGPMDSPVMAEFPGSDPELAISQRGSGVRQLGESASNLPGRVNNQ